MSAENSNDPASETENVKDASKETRDETVSLDFDETVGDLSAAIKVDKLVAKIDKLVEDDAEHDREVKARLDKLREQQDYDDNVDSTFNFNLEEDL